MSALQAVLNVFEEMGTWITSAVNNLIPMFYVAEGENAGLTFIGVLTVAGLSIAVTLLLLNVIKDFIRFR